MPMEDLKRINPVELTLSSDQVASSLRQFKSRRDSLLHDDVATFEHQLERFLGFCANDPLARKVLGPTETRSADAEAWWEAASQHNPDASFPTDPDDELTLRYRPLQSARTEPNHIFKLGIAHHQSKRDGWVEFFRTLVVRSFAEALSHRIGEAANLATPEARSIKAVPLSRIPAANETRMFLSHKSVDKPLVYRYYNAETHECGGRSWVADAVHLQGCFKRLGRLR